jgi:hypothetical protein
MGLRYEVEAFNTATASQNRIHDDEVAQRFGFRGGLVPKRSTTSIEGVTDSRYLG